MHRVTPMLSIGCMLACTIRRIPRPVIGQWFVYNDFVPALLQSREAGDQPVDTDDSHGRRKRQKGQNQQSASQTDDAM
jgi:hypothetical protein